MNGRQTTKFLAIFLVTLSCQHASSQIAEQSPPQVLPLVPPGEPVAPPQVLQSPQPMMQAMPASPPYPPTMVSPSMLPPINGCFPAVQTPPMDENSTFRWGWFGNPRYESPSRWHYDYQRSAMRWRYCR